MLFKKSLLQITASLVLLATTQTMAATYDRFGISDHDIEDWKSMTESIHSCRVAEAAIPDAMHPPANGPLLARVAINDRECRHI